MKLISKEIRVNEMTYAPECVLTIAIPIESMTDAEARVGLEELEKILGKQLVEVIKSKKA